MNGLRWIYLFGAILFIGPHHAQDIRKTVLIEQFTQASCPPCNPTNIYLNNLLKGYPKDEVVIMRYQTSFPGYDPMYKHNSREISDRQRYYQVASVPSSVINGEGPKYTRDFVTTSRLDKELKEHADCILQLDAQYSARYDSVYVYAVVRALRPFRGNEKLRIALIERHIRYDEPPGTNGEKEFFNVFRRFITGAEGTPLTTLVEGDSQVLHFSAPLSAIYQRHQLALVGFVQNDDDRAVYQTQYLELTLPRSGDLVLIGLHPHANPSVDVSCFSSIGPFLKLYNASAQRVHSFDINYQINGRAAKYTHRKGILPYDTITLQLPSIDFALKAANTLYASIEYIDGIEDSYAANDTISSAFSLAPYVAPGSLHIALARMRNPEDIQLTVRENDSFLLAQNGFPSHQKDYEVSIPLYEGNCYAIELINHASGASNGALKITHSAGTTLKRLRRLRKDTITLLMRTFRSTYASHLHKERANALALKCVETHPHYWVVAIRCPHSQPIVLQLRDPMGRLWYTKNIRIRAGVDHVVVPRPKIAQGIVYLSTFYGQDCATLPLPNW